MSDPLATWPDGDWDSVDPVAAGFDRSQLEAIGAILARPGSNTNAFLVVKSGKIAWEQYYYGSDREDRHHLYSVTKSFISALVGFALKDGALRSVDQRLVEFFPELALQPSGDLGQLTLRHLLTMTVGFLWPLGGWAREPMVERLRRSPDWTRFILELPIRRTEIGRFHYCSAASHLLSSILTRATGLTACEYGRERLFGRIGINGLQSGVDWETDPQNLNLGGWGLHLTAREVARLGWLYVCEGQWRGQVILPRGWIEESTHLTDSGSSGYGYQWWLRRIGGEAVFAGLGAGGQYLFCIPARQMVVVILSRYVHRWPDRWQILSHLLSTA